jgi:hypothetical protein
LWVGLREGTSAGQLSLFCATSYLRLRPLRNFDGSACACACAFLPFPYPSLSFIQLFFVRFPCCSEGKCLSLVSRFVAGQRASGPAGRERILMPWSFWCLSSAFVLAAAPPPPPPGKNSRGVNASSTHLGEAAAAALRLSTGEDSCLIRASVSCSTGWHRTVGRPDFVKGVL